ncbi:MAG: 1-acyl-sn-glycerol-3-phosphate acyltransferase [Bacteroidales bacterium]|jgi:1-acyl-sn-glycerol-3-phosphate acyltransferase|nr:1-acyl-sn-glycerol-3-phosphate acyltransferase [Bacteroidales bacterium]
MINYRKIGEHSYAWDIIMPYYRFALADAFFKECLVVGRENIPPPGTPTFVIANHQNSVNDALLIVSMFKDYRQPVSLARGDFFVNKTIAKIFRFWRVMPTFRIQDSRGKSDMLKNLETFEIASNILKKGGVIIMFPEAMHQQRRILGTFKKGVPRICFSAEEANNFHLNLQILPVNLHYSNIQLFREKALIEIGKPFKFNEFFETYKNNPNDAYLKFNDKARTVLKSMVLHIEDNENYEAFDFLREIIRSYRIENNYKKYNYYDEFKEEKKVITEIDALKDNDPDKFQTLISETKKYSELLKKLNFKDYLLNENKTGVQLTIKTLLMFLFFPVFLFGFVNNAIPCGLANLLTRKIKDKVFIGTFRFLLGFLLFPLWYIGICTAASLIAHSLIIGLLYTVLAFISLFWFYRYRVNMLKLWHKWRFFFQRKTKAILQLKNLRNNILLSFQ